MIVGDNRRFRKFGGVACENSCGDSYRTSDTEGDIMIGWLGEIAASRFLSSV